jgi:two-component system nitrogen regulation response regulator NtrX
VERRALVVDDRVESRELVAGDLAEAGFCVAEAEDGLDAWRRFRHHAPDLVVTDLRMPGADGIELLRRIRGVSSVPVILLTACGDVPTAVAAIKGGAQEFLAFPDDLERVVDRARALTRDPREPSDAEKLAARIVGRSAATRRLRDRVLALAPLRVPVLVSGEAGTGHDHVIRCLHELSAGAGAKLARARSGAAGALARPMPGVATYLDEVGSFTPAEQVHWFERLCEIQSGEPAAASRIFASTSEDFAQRACDGSYHPALAERLLRFRVPIAPLRERPEDVAPLVSHLADRIGREMGRERVRFERSAIALMRTSAWPGNVRELAKVVEKLVAFSPGGGVTRDRVREVFGELQGSVATLRQQRNQRQRDELVALLESCGGNLAEVARRLDISRGAVISRAQKHGLLPRPPKSPCSG